MPALPAEAPRPALPAEARARAAAAVISRGILSITKFCRKKQKNAENQTPAPFGFLQSERAFAIMCGCARTEPWALFPPGADL